MFTAIKASSADLTIRRLGPAEHYAIDTSDGEMVAATAVTPHTADYARLFAAAPQMLRKLQEILEWANDYEDVDDGIPNDANRVKGMIGGLVDEITGKWAQR